MTWLLTGGAGYIGSHIIRALRATGYDVVVLDDLSTGDPWRVPAEVPLVRASILDRATVTKVLLDYDISGVIHLAAKKSVSDSVACPAYYHVQNVLGLRRLLDAMATVGVTRLVFSSSAAVYGNPTSDLVDETFPTVPVSPYGQTKLLGEQIVRRAGLHNGLSWLALRYFNVAGAGPPHLGDTGVANLMSMVFQALDQGRQPQIFGADYPTRDGTCMRDYIHVADVAEAHVAAAGYVEQNAAGTVYNIGRGVGVTVREMLDVIQTVTGQTFQPTITARRAGDPAAVVARTTAIEKSLGWTARYNIADMVSTAWAAHQFVATAASLQHPPSLMPVRDMQAPEPTCVGSWHRHAREESVARCE
jgi:UDP-glucose 4-epimerase